MMDLSDPKVIASFITVLGGLLGIAFKYGLDWLDRHMAGRAEQKRNLASKQGMRNMGRAYATIDELRSITSAHRVILFAGHNCGGVPRPDAPFFVTQLYPSVGDSRHDKLPIIREYQNLTVDAHYINLLCACQTEPVVLNTADMPPCQLKRHYESEGVVHSVVIGLGFKDAQFLYISVAKYDGDVFTASETTRMELKCRYVWQCINDNC